MHATAAAGGAAPLAWPAELPLHCKLAAVHVCDCTGRGALAHDLQTCSLCNPCCAGVELQWTSSNAVLLASLPGDVTLLGTGSTAAILPASQGPALAEAVTAMLQAATRAAQANADKRAKLMVEAQKVNHHAARCGVALFNKMTVDWHWNA